MRYILGLLVVMVFCSFKASYYHDKYEGRITYSGDVFSQNKLTCASNTHPMGTMLKVTNVENNKSVIVKVNDTGRFTKVTLDLSKRAFKKIADLDKGIINVIIKKL